MTETQTILKAEELRIGNWVQLNNDFIQIKNVAVEGINVSGGYDGELIGDDYEEIQPIPLTPEILEKAGFKIEYGWGINYFHPEIPIGVSMYKESTHHLMIKEPQYDDFGDVISENQCRQMNYKCEYVHQLQNLYFALTGEELIINL